MEMKLQKGFTLIELLVVIAIIGLLAAVVLSSLGTARNKGIDATVQTQVSSIRSQAELYASSNGNSYIGVCDAALDIDGLGGATGPGLLAASASSTGATIVTGSSATSLATGAETQVTCNEEVSAWMVEAPLTESAVGAAHMWCADSTGYSAEQTSINAGTTVCQ